MTPFGTWFAQFVKSHMGWHPRDDEIWDAAIDAAATICEEDSTDWFVRESQSLPQGDPIALARGSTAKYCGGKIRQLATPKKATPSNDFSKEK